MTERRKDQHARSGEKEREKKREICVDRDFTSLLLEKNVALKFYVYDKMKKSPSAAAAAYPPKLQRASESKTRLIKVDINTDFTPAMDELTD